MSRTLLQQLLFIALVIIFGTSGYCADSKGYKIILASFPNFDNAKTKMELLGKELTPKDWELQEKYGYTIVARSSGNVFIVAIEPLQDKEAVNSVIERFKKFYPDAYSNGYFGPTKGAIVLTPPIIKAPNTSDLKQTSPITPPPIFKSTNKWEWIIAVLSLIVSGMFLMRMGKNTKSKTDSLIETIEEKLTIAPKEVHAKIKEIESVKITQEDIFYTLKSNRFFKMLIDELKKGSDEREEQQCHNLIYEMRRYEKKFHTSSIITEMEELVFAKKFKELSEFITLKNNGN
jgi:hypothetical protein